MIVGALANEGGLGRGDFGRIDIRADHSLVELPPHLPAETWEKLGRTRVSGKLIDLQLDDGRPERFRAGKPKREAFGDRRDKRDKGGRRDRY